MNNGHTVFAKKRKNCLLKKCDCWHLTEQFGGKCNTSFTFNTLPKDALEVALCQTGLRVEPASYF
jgi:hypothetical protein